MASRSKKENSQNQQPIGTLKGPSAGEAQSVVMRPMADVGFWKERRDDFSSDDIEKEHGSLYADWDSITDTWGFRGGSGEQSARVFKALARKAASGLKGPRTSTPWKVWLDFMRHEEWGFKSTATSETVYRQPVLDDLVRMGMPSPVVEGTTETVDVTKALANRVKADCGISIKPGKRVKLRAFRGIFRTIERLFKTSAEFCLELDARAGELPSKRVRNTESASENVPDWDDLKRQKSLFKIRAAQVFRVKPRTIYNWLRDHKLNQTPLGRVAVDQKFKDLFRGYYSTDEE